MRLFLLLTTLTTLLLPGIACAEQSSSYWEAGLRGGVDDGRNLDESYGAAELYLLKELPWETTLGKNVSLGTRFDAGLFYLDSSGEESGMLAAGFDLVFGFWEDTVELEIGCRPTAMFDHKQGEDDFGGWFQLTSHAGLAYHWHNLLLNYRIQHTSNAGIYDKNPGLNVHMFGMGYRF